MMHTEQTTMHTTTQSAMRGRHPERTPSCIFNNHMEIPRFSSGSSISAPDLPLCSTLRPGPLFFVAFCCERRSPGPRVRSASQFINTVPPTNRRTSKKWQDTCCATKNNRPTGPATPYSNGDPPPAFATTSSETIGFSIEFGFAELIYVSLEIFREFYIDFVDIRHEIRVFTRFRLPHHTKYRPNIANSMPHAPKPLGTRTKLLWTLLMMENVLPLMEEMTKPMDMIATLLSTRTYAILDRQHQHLHRT
jgi:hypothetical protein